MAVLVILLMTAALVFASGGQAGAVQTGPSKIVVELFDRGTDGGRTRVDNNAWTDWIKAKVQKDLNLEVTFFAVPRFEEPTVIPTLMASGSAPDLCYTYSSPALNSFRDQGGLVNLTPYVDRLLPDMKKLLGADPIFQGKDFIWRNLQAADNKMWSIPSYRVALAMNNIFIREDWLAKLGLPLPKNTQEFYEALVAFRDKDPGNVGRNNVVPLLTDRDCRWTLANFINPSIDPKISEKDEYIYGWAARARVAFPGYKDGLRMMNKWYNEDLIFKDFPLLVTADDVYNTIKSGVVGAFSGNWDLPYRTDYKIIENLRMNVPGANFVPVDCIQSSDGLTHKLMYDKVGLQIFVPSQSKNPEAALRYLNWLCIKENYNFLQIGQEGINHKLTNGVPEIIARPANDPWFQNSSQNIDFTMAQNGVEMGSQDMNVRVLALSYGGFPADVIVNAYDLSTRNAKASVVVQIPTTQDGVYGQILNDKIDALLAQAIMAPPANFDAIFDAGMADLMNSGGRDVLNERTQVANQVWP